jgi:hypothetical protein
MITQNMLDNWFTYHPPQNASDQERYELIRDTGKMFAKVVLGTTPPSADQTAAIRKIREAVATANMAIACGGR